MHTGWGVSLNCRPFFTTCLVHEDFHGAPHVSITSSHEHLAYEGAGGTGCTHPEDKWVMRSRVRQARQQQTGQRLRKTQLSSLL